MNLILPIYKPKGPSSFAMISAVRRATGEKRVGHAGTLDPLASGVLVVAIGREATKRLAEEVKKEKEYLADVYLGYESTTDDAEGEKQEVNAAKKPTLAEIEKAAAEFVGLIMQTPPAFSAIKVAGKRSYKLARAGQAVALAPRPAEIKAISVEAYNYPILQLKVITGPGVYIRALGRDLGQKLGTGAYLSDLVRTRVGDFTLAQAIKPEDLAEFLEGKN